MVDRLPITGLVGAQIISGTTHPLHSLRVPQSLVDPNTGLHRLDEERSSFYCEDRFRRLLAQGWVDVWRERNPKRREFSWFSTTGNGFRIDHALASPPLASVVRSVAYSHDERLREISDHTGMLLELE